VRIGSEWIKLKGARYWTLGSCYHRLTSSYCTRIINSKCRVRRSKQHNQEKKKNKWQRKYVLQSDVQSYSKGVLSIFLYCIGLNFHLVRSVPCPLYQS